WHVSSNSPATHVPNPATGGWWQFARTPKMSTYITAVVAGNFQVVKDRHGSIDLAVLCRQSLARYLDADEIFDITRRGFDFFTEEFAYPYQFGKYDQAFVPEFNAGAMENAGLVTFAEHHIFRPRVTDATHPIVADMPDIESVKVNFDGITYAKGASVLRQLVAWVGEEAFTTGIRNYFRRHAFGNTTLDDFLEALEESSGRDLQAWSKE